MIRTQSVWKDEETARQFLENERGMLPGEDLQFSVICEIIKQWADNPSVIMDLGCGSGVLGSLLLDKFPRATGVFVDFSDTMLDAARNTLGDYPNSILLNTDFGFNSWVESVGPLKPFDVIVSGFAIHHQPDDRKKELYRELLQLLTPGGVFLNLEHVVSQSPEIENLFEQYYIDQLYKAGRENNSSVTREEISDRFKSRPDRNEDRLTPVETQCQWLRELGFTDVDCFFKLFEIAIFGGRKK